MGNLREEVVRLYSEGSSYTQIGKTFGISRQRVEQIVKGPRKRDPGPKVMLRAGEVARLLGIHVNTVRRWSKQGLLKTYRISPRGDRRFRLMDIERFLEERIIEREN